MVEHWDQAEFVLETLVRKAAKIDKNGMDLSFTLGNVEVRGKQSTSYFLEAMDHKDAKPHQTQTDMNSALGAIFDGYIRYLQNPSSEKKNLTLMVLTDGIWGGTFDKHRIKEKIVEFIRDVTQILGRHREHPVGIQFIQFGEDPDATYRLQSLDDDLTYEFTNPFDIIVMEPADGDVYKMFLGNFVENYDNLKHRKTLSN